jgi:adenine-specific DNA-methyltransferase
MIPTSAETAIEIKSRGAFYTPAQLTRFLSRWAVRTTNERVLEPSCGDGAFVTAVADRFAALGRITLGGQLIGVEREPAEAERARTLAPMADIRTLDFFDLEPSAIRSVDAVIGNPPYIRYHAFRGSNREKALARAQAQGVELTGLASSWAHFVVHATAFLKPAGRLAFVLPAELLHTDYGRPVREFLLQRFSSVLVVAFDRMVFAEAQVDAVLLLASHDDATGLRVLRVPDEASLESLDLAPIARGGNGHTLARWSSAMYADAGGAYESAVEEYGAARLGSLASVDIGFVTGANDFFVLSAAEAEERSLPRDILTPAVRRPRDVPGLEVRSDELSWLLDLRGRDIRDPAIWRYLAEGESRGIPERYKCRVRDPWYAVPKPRQQPDAFIPYMAHLGPRLIINKVGARSSNLLHGVSLLPGAPPARALAVAMCSSLTLLSAEVEGRAYGGGVLKLETREAENLVVPAFASETASALAGQFGDVDSLIRSGRWDMAALRADGVLGMDHHALWKAYLAFRDRRLGRRRPRTATGTD